jgi:hypothetical protein
MTSPVDPNEVMMTGENSFIRLSDDGGKTHSERFSHWRVLWCPGGAGHAMFVKSALTGGDIKIYADNPGVARWLQKEIETLLYPAFGDASLPVQSAQFSRSGGVDATATERVTTPDGEIVLTWTDFISPFVLNMPPGSAGRPIGVFSTFFPAKKAHAALGKQTAPGAVWQEKRGDRDSSSACLAWSETWVKPK